jgi:hypothetical protein
MLQHHPSGSWLRTLYGLLAAVAAMTLAACGGGSGAPNNPYTPGPSLLTVTPAAVTAYPGVATTLSVTGGTPPYRAFSSNSGVLPVAQTMTGSLLTLVAGGIDSDTTVTITIQDSGGQSAVATVSVKAQQPVALTVVPSVAIAYSGIASTLTVTGGVPPYRASSSNTTVLPVAQAVPGSTVVLLAANVGGDTAVDVTIQDAAGQRATAAVTVRAAPLLNSLTITPSGSDCGTSAICSGQNGTAVVTVLGPEGAALAGRQVKFDVIAGPYGITAPTAGQPVVNTLTVTSDSTGKAGVLIKANVNAPTQYAQLRVTELTSGQQLVGNFLIQQVTDGSKVLAVVPSEATITAAFKGECSSDVRIDYYIYGGTPPYRVKASFPDAITIVNQVVAESGGFFEAVTNGQCVNPLTFSIVDAAGRQTTATLKNLEGTADAPVVPAALVVTSNPATPFTGACDGKNFVFTVDGGTPPYNVSATKGTVTPQVVPSAGQTTSVFGLIKGDKSTISIVDSTKPVKTFTTDIVCN